MPASGRRAAPVEWLTGLLAGVLLTASTAVAGPSGPAPDTKFEGVSGEPASLADYRGRLVVFNLWATWCSPCLIEIPHLVDLQQRLAEHDATVIGLALDSGGADTINAFWRNRLELEPVYPLWIGTVGQAAELFGAHTFPQTLIVDRNGRIREQLVGLQTEADLWQALEPYL